MKNTFKASFAYDTTYYVKRPCFQRGCLDGAYSGHPGADPGIFYKVFPWFSRKCEVEGEIFEVDGSSYSAFHTA